MAEEYIQDPLPGMEQIQNPQSIDIPPWLSSDPHIFFPNAYQSFPHSYLSTSCRHDKHDYCQSVTGSNGSTEWDKAPAECKFCSAPCICLCHEEKA